MKLDNRQFQRVSESVFRNRLAQAMLRGVPGFETLAAEERVAFIGAAVAEASGHGLRTEQGLAAYAVALCYLEPDFPATSHYLHALLASTLPEVRKVHAMNEWVSARIGEPDAVGVADARLKNAYGRTRDWGVRS